MRVAQLTRLIRVYQVGDWQYRAKLSFLLCKAGPYAGRIARIEAYHQARDVDTMLKYAREQAELTGVWQ